MTRLIVGFAATCIAGVALAQAPAPLGDSAQRMIGSWEFSNADRDRTCTATFKSDRAPGGLKIEFDANCVNLFPLVRDIAAWKFPDNDLLYLLDAQGQIGRGIQRGGRRDLRGADAGRRCFVSAKCRRRRRAAKAARAGRRRLGDRAQVRIRQFAC